MTIQDFYETVSFDKEPTPDEYFHESDPFDDEEDDYSRADILEGEEKNPYLKPDA